MITKDCKYTLTEQNSQRRTTEWPGACVRIARRKKWNWLGHRFSRNDNSIAKQALQWTPQDRRGRLRPREIWGTCRRRTQLEEDGDDSTRQNCVETSAWTVVSAVLEALSHKSSKHPCFALHCFWPFSFRRFAVLCTVLLQQSVVRNGLSRFVSDQSVMFN